MINYSKIKSLIYSLFLFVIFGFAKFPLHKTIQTEIKYKNYFNKTFGFSVDYPYEILKPQGESLNGDGQTFKSAKTPNNSLTVCRDYLDVMDPEVTFTIEVGFNKEVKACTNKDSKRKLTYKKLDKNFYVLSGYKQNGDIFYQKSILIDGTLFTCLLEYKVEDKALFNKISERVFKSFK